MLWQICEDMKLDNGTIQPLQPLWHPFPGLLYSLFWLKLIASSALYHCDNTERCEVDSVDFIIAHFHMNNSGEEVFNLPTYLYCAYKLHNANTHTVTHTYPRLPYNCPSQSLTGPFSFCLLCGILLSRVDAGRDGMWGTVSFAKAAANGCWNLQDSYGLWPGVEGVQSSISNGYTAPDLSVLGD